MLLRFGRVFASHADNRVFKSQQIHEIVTVPPPNAWQEQGRSQELEMGGAKLLGEGSGGRLRRLRPPVRPG